MLLNHCQILVSVLKEFLKELFGSPPPPQGGFIKYQSFFNLKKAIRY